MQIGDVVSHVGAANSSYIVIDVDGDGDMFFMYWGRDNIGLRAPKNLYKVIGHLTPEEMITHDCEELRTHALKLMKRG